MNAPIQTASETGKLQWPASEADKLRRPASETDRLRWPAGDTAVAEDKVARWFSKRLPAWQKIASQLALVERGNSISSEDIFATIHSYPEIARDLAVARRASPHGRLTYRLEAIYAELHRALFQRPGTLKRELAALVLREAPNIARSLRGTIAAIALLFALATAAGAWLIWAYPELVSLFASEKMINGVMHGQLWTDGLLNVAPSSILSVQIFTNNIIVALTTLCLGVIYGLGTLYIISINGLMLGGMFAFTARYGLAGRLFEFICAHGFVEISCICVAGAIGASLGEAIARPGRQSRSAAFQRAALQGSKLMIVLVAFLVGAGLLEGFVSPEPKIPRLAKLAIGLCYFGFFLAVISGRLHFSKKAL